MKPYEKVHSSFAEQQALLASRGMQVADKDACDHALRTIGYYRLSGYWYPLREPIFAESPGGEERIIGRLDAFIENATFDQVMSLWTFDSQLRILILQAIEQVEIATRVACAYTLGTDGPFAHLEPKLLDAKFTKPIEDEEGVPGLSRHDLWLAEIREHQANRDDDFVVHHEITYGGDLPIWVLVEILQFGQLMQLQSALPWSHKLDVARLLAVDSPETVQGWLAALIGLRNKAAHQARLWNASFPLPKRAKSGTIPDLEHLRLLPKKGKHGIYNHLCMLKYLMIKFDPHSSWHSEFAALLDNFPAVPFQSLSNAGFPADWRNQALWS